MQTLQGIVALTEIGCLRIAHTQTVAGNLVGIGRANALQRRANLGVAFGLLVGGIHHAMARQYKVSFLRNKQVLRGIDPLLGQRLDLLTENARLDKHTVANQVNLLAVENTRRDNMQHMFRAVEFERVARIGATLETRHHIIVGSEHIDNLSLALVTPLQS